MAKVPDPVGRILALQDNILELVPFDAGDKIWGTQIMMQGV
jgi:hypothetical protein